MPYESYRSGQSMGEFTLGRKLGSGAFGSVWEARKPQDPVVFAVKVFDRTQDPGNFNKEAQRLEALHHQNVVPYRGHGINTDRTPYIAMLKASDGSLRDRMRNGILPVDQAHDAIQQIAAGLAYIHTNRIVHQDMKPENVLNNGGTLWVADLGIAATPYRTGAHAGGTVPYMAPEVFLGKISRKGDQYSLGVLAYEMLTGQLPIRVDQGDFKQWGIAHQRQVVQLFPQIWNEAKLPDPDQIHLRLALESAIRQALAKTKEQRHDSVLDFANALNEAYKKSSRKKGSVPPQTPTPKPYENRAPQPVGPKRRWGRIALGITAVGVTGVLGVKACDSDEKNYDSQPKPKPSITALTQSPLQPRSELPPSPSPSPSLSESPSTSPSPSRSPRRSLSISEQVERMAINYESDSPSEYGEQRLITGILRYEEVAPGDYCASIRYIETGTLERGSETVEITEDGIEGSCTRDPAFSVNTTRSDENPHTAPNKSEIEKITADYYEGAAGIKETADYSKLLRVITDFYPGGYASFCQTYQWTEGSSVHETTRMFFGDATSGDWTINHHSDNNTCSAS